MDDFERELKDAFLVEASQLLDNVEQAFLSLEENKNNPETINEIFRLAHNLKGTSRAVGFGEVAEFTHKMENLILKLKNKELEVNDNAVSVLLECNDMIRNMIDTLKSNLEHLGFDTKAIVDRIQALLDGKIEAPAPAEAAPVEVTPAEMPADPAPAEIVPANEGKWSEVDQIQDLLAQNNLNTNFVTEEKPVAPVEVKQEVKPEPPKTTKAPTKTEDDSIRVSLTKIETLNNLVGELVIMQSVMQQSQNGPQGLAVKTLRHLSKLSRDIQEISMSLRMVPIKSTLQKMHRIVRDTSKVLNKKVNLQLVGEETEIDRTVLEHLGDPLVHIVRNAVDHGLELPEDRLKANKNEMGNVVIRAFHEGNNLILEISDDGKGINGQYLYEKAVKKGVIRPNQPMSDEEKIYLIFHPGFSSKDEVSEISGRGVGMDVVKTNIEKLSGKVFVRTEVGRGSTIRIELPLTLAIIEGVVVNVGKDRYIFPLGQIHETLRATPEILHHVEGMGECLYMRGEVIPLFKMAKALQCTEEKKSLDQSIIIVKTNEFHYGVLVDAILHQQQVVIKPLGKEIINHKGFMGSSILGDGKPALIIDLIKLFGGLQKINKNRSIIGEAV